MYLMPTEDDIDTYNMIIASNAYTCTFIYKACTHGYTHTQIC